jgi:signal transduction histidine kinase
MRRAGSWVALFLLCLAWLVPACASDAGLRWSVLEDRSGTLQLDDVRTHDAQFRPATARTLNPGSSTSAWWLRLEVDVPPGEAWQRWLVLRSARLTQVQLWTPAPQGWQRQDAGTDVPHAQWPLDTPTPSFAVELPGGRSSAIYLRVAGHTALALDSSVCLPRDCQIAQATQLMLGSAVAAFLAVVAIACLAMALMLRQPAALAVAGFSLAYGLYELTEQGLAFQYFWPQASDWAGRALIPLVALTHMMRALVLYALIGTELQQPMQRLLMLGLIALYPPIIALGWWGYDLAIIPVVMPLMTAGVLLGTGLAWAAWWRGARYGLPVAALMTLTMLAGLARIAHTAGLLPTSPLTLHLAPALSVFGGLVVLAVLLSHLRSVDRARATSLAMLEESRKSQAQRARLLAYVGHDLRAPLVATLNHLRQLEQGPASAQRAVRQSIERSVAHQLELIDELVAHARGETDQLDLVPTACFLHALLHELAEQGRGLAIMRGNRFEARIADELPGVVRVDAKRLRQLLVNLLSNAAKYTHNGQVSLIASLEHGSEAAKLALRCEVVDDGPGIAADDLPRLFEPFWRSPDQAGQPGTGLGLAIALQLAKAMGGTLEAISQPGQGSRFVLTVPLNPTPASEVAWPGLAAEAPEPLGRGRVALLVDPDAGCTEHLAELLYAAEFEVASTPNALQAATRLAELQPALMICGDIGAAAAQSLLIASRSLSQPPATVLYTDRPQPAAPHGEPDFGARCLKPLTGRAWWTLLSDLMAPPPMPPTGVAPPAPRRRPARSH